jgi:hypothetical protein
MPSHKTSFLELPSTSKTQVDKEALQAVQAAVEVAPMVWDMMEQTLGDALDADVRESLDRARAVTRRLADITRTMQEGGDVPLDRKVLREDSNLFLKVRAVVFLLFPNSFILIRRLCNYPRLSRHTAARTLPRYGATSSSSLIPRRSLPSCSTSRPFLRSRPVMDGPTHRCLVRPRSALSLTPAFPPPTPTRRSGPRRSTVSPQVCRGVGLRSHLRVRNLRPCRCRSSRAVRSRLRRSRSRLC